MQSTSTTAELSVSGFLRRLLSSNQQFTGRFGLEINWGSDSDCVPREIQDLTVENLRDYVDLTQTIQLFELLAVYALLASPADVRQGVARSLIDQLGISSILAGDTETLWSSLPEDQLSNYLTLNDTTTCLKAGVLYRFIEGRRNRTEFFGQTFELIRRFVVDNGGCSYPCCGDPPCHQCQSGVRRPLGSRRTT